jgi:hypothetical protein
MRRLEAQVNGRRDGRVRTEDGVGELEEGVAPGVEALVERAAEALESIGRFHDAPIMHPPPAFRTPYLPAGLKRKLSSSSLLWICSPSAAPLHLPTASRCDWFAIIFPLRIALTTPTYY